MLDLGVYFFKNQIMYIHICICKLDIKILDKKSRILNVITKLGETELRRNSYSWNGTTQTGIIITNILHHNL